MKKVRNRCTRGTGSDTFDFRVALLSPLRQQGADVTMASIPKVLDGQSDPSTGEEVTQPVTGNTICNELNKARVLGS